MSTTDNNLATMSDLVGPLVESSAEDIDFARRRIAACARDAADRAVLLAALELDAA